jgi:peptidoglycan/LPS O-acetylase OafA/YrhL
MLWYLFQFAVFFGIFAWTNETGIGHGLGIAPVVTSAAVAFGLTWLLGRAVDWWRRRKQALLFRSHESVDDGRPPWV